MKQPDRFTFWEAVKWEAGCAIECHGYSWLHAWVSSFFWQVRMRLKALCCRCFDHDWEDCSFAGPESGNDDKVCRRCGYYWDIPMY